MFFRRDEQRIEIPVVILFWGESCTTFVRSDAKQSLGITSCSLVMRGTLTRNGSRCILPFRLRQLLLRGKCFTQLNEQRAFHPHGASKVENIGGNMKVTFTGIDARTDLSELPHGPEYGILYSFNPDGRSRYPSRREIWQILRRLTNRGNRVALHVCGTIARHQLIEYRLADLTHYVERIQVNGIVFPDDLKAICERYSDHTVITQHSIQNGELAELNIPNHAILVDGSGGRGVSPKEWKRPKTEKPVGFAGGLGPDNIGAEIVKIESVAVGEFWVDMEGKLRDENDWLDVTRIQRVFDCLVPL